MGKFIYILLFLSISNCLCQSDDVLSFDRPTINAPISHNALDGKGADEPCEKPDDCKYGFSCNFKHPDDKTNTVCIAPEFQGIIEGQ